MADVTTGANAVHGDTAHDAADVGRPIKIGGKANAALPTAVSEGDRVDASFDLQGRQRVAVDHSTGSIGDGRKTVASAGTSEAIASTTACKWVQLQAETDNTGVIVVGSSTVVASQATRRGIALNPGGSETLLCTDLADVYIDSTVNGDGVTFIYGAA